MISPYQKILPETLKERKAYMDRCSQIGMKVHYNLLSVSGGGGVSSAIDGISEDEKKATADIRNKIFYGSSGPSGMVHFRRTKWE